MNRHDPHRLYEFNLSSEHRERPSEGPAIEKADERLAEGPAG